MRIKEIDNLVTSLRVLPGVGEKTAKRYAFELIEADSAKQSELIESLKAISSIKKCSECNGYSQEHICPICSDDERDMSKLVVVANAKEILKVEDILPNMYRYFALGGVIDPLNGIGSGDIKIKELLDVCEKNNVKEITLILPVTNEGEITASFIKRSFAHKDIKFNKIAQGVPIGSSLEYLDEITLIKSIQSAVDY